MFTAPAMQKHMSEKEAAEISLCLADFLAFCHSKGVVHRWAAAATFSGLCSKLMAAACGAPCHELEHLPTQSHKVA